MIITNKERAEIAHKRQMMILRRRETMCERYGTPSVAGTTLIRMDVGPWFIDPADKLPTRIVRQVER